MWAAVPASGGPREGMLETKPQVDVAGKRLLINAVTRADGCVHAELVGTDGEVITGFERDACQAFSGDVKCAPMAWKGGEVCPCDGVQLRLILKRARLYGFAWG
ncbi:MAG: hypothetical protein CMJ18_12100 [Phycisphaeraceae bacterium]|nr:hypothetical protein [Phycisphaeraceae bacterium]